jgi:hypothetical protein
LIHGFCLYFVIVSLCFLMFSGFCFFLIPICFFLILICFFWSLFVFFLIPLPARNLVEDGHRDNLRLHLKDLRTRPPHEMGNMNKTCGFSGFTWKNRNLAGFSEN